MSFAASLIARLGLDATGFRSELAAAEGQAAGSHGRMGNAADRNADSHERLLRSNHRVAAQINHFSRDLLSGASAAQVFESGLVGLERALNLPLGALAGLAIAGIGVQKIGEFVKEFKKLNEEVDKLNESRPNASNQTLEQLRKTADEAEKKVDQLQKRLRDIHIPYSLNTLVESLTSGPSTGQRLKETRETRTEAVTGEVEKARVKNDLHGQPEFVAKGVAIEEKFYEVVQRLGQRGVVQLERELANLAADIAKTRRERLQLSLSDIAGAAKPELVQGGEWNNRSGESFVREGNLNRQSPQALYNARQAQEAQKLEAQARDLVLNQADLEGAQRLRTRADDIKNGIGTLKDSEKDLTGALRGALDSARVLQEILGAINKVNFANR